MTNYSKTMAESLMEVRKIEEATMKDSQIAQLKKAYEPMRGKKISTGNAQKLSKMMDRFTDNKQLMIQLVKADIPFVSSFAITQLISKHNMKGAEINKLKKEEMEFWESLEEHKGDEPHNHPHDEDELDEVQKVARQLKDPKKEVMLVKKNKVIVVDRKDEKKYLSKGWQLAEEVELDEKLKYEGKFKKGDTIKSFDFPVSKDNYIIGKITGTEMRQAAKVYVIKVTNDSGKTSGARVGDTGYVPMGMYRDYDGRIVKEEVELDEGSTAPFKKGDKIKVPHKGKLRDGKVVRYVPQRGSWSPYYVVDVGEPRSIEVPAHKVKQHNENLDEHRLTATTKRWN